MRRAARILLAEDKRVTAEALPSEFGGSTATRLRSAYCLKLVLANRRIGQYSDPPTWGPGFTSATRVRAAASTDKTHLRSFESPNVERVSPI